MYDLRYMSDLVFLHTWMTKGGGLALFSVGSPEDSVEEVLLAVLSDPVSVVVQTSLVFERRRRLPGGGMADGQA